MTSVGETQVAEWADGRVRRFTLSAANAGLAEGSLEELKGGDGAYNAERLGALLDGAPGTYRDTVVMTAAGALVVAAQASDFRDGVDKAQKSIDAGKAKACLTRMVEISNETPQPPPKEGEE